MTRTSYKSNNNVSCENLQSKPWSN